MKNEDGFSLIQVMVAAGLMGLVAMFMMKMQEKQLKNQNTIATKAEMTGFLQKVDSYFSSPGYCEANLQGKKINETTEVQLKEYTTPNGKVLLETGVAYGNRHLKLAQIKQKDFFFDDDDKSSGILTLNIGMDKIKNTFGAKRINRDLEVFVSFNTDGTVSGCSSGNHGMQGVNKATTASIEDVQSVIDKSGNDSDTSQNVNESITNSNNEGIKKQAANQNLNAKEKDIKKVIDNNPMLKELQQTIKRIKESNKQLEQQNNYD